VKGKVFNASISMISDNLNNIFDSDEAIVSTILSGFPFPDENKIAEAIVITILSGFPFPDEI
jgi:hypothetical protein